MGEGVVASGNSEQGVEMEEAEEAGATEKDIEAADVPGPNTSPATPTETDRTAGENTVDDISTDPAPSSATISTMMLPAASDIAQDTATGTPQLPGNKHKRKGAQAAVEASTQSEKKRRADLIKKARTYSACEVGILLFPALSTEFLRSPFLALNQLRTSRHDTLCPPTRDSLLQHLQDKDDPSNDIGLPSVWPSVWPTIP